MRLQQERSNFASKYSSAQSYASNTSVESRTPCPPVPMHTLENDDLEINGIYKRNAIISAKKELLVEQQIKKDYNPYLIPPDWKAAEKHSMARRVGVDKRPSPNIPSDYDVCPCCNYQIDLVSIWEKPTKLSFLGSGYPLFFNYIEYCIYILVTIIVSSGAFNIFSNFYGHSCETVISARDPNDHTCQADWISVFSLANKNKQTSEIQDMLNFLTIFSLMILLIFFRKNQKEIDIECDMKETTPADFTIMIKDIPLDTSLEQLQEFFESLEFDAEQEDQKDDEENNNIHKEPEKIKIKVQEVSFVYDTREVDALYANIEEIVEEKKKALMSLEPDSAEFASVAEEFDKRLQEQEKTIGEEMQKVSSDSAKFTGYAFVSFDTEVQKSLILESAEKSFWEELYESIFSQSSEFKNFQFGEHTIQISEAPEPLDILWENMNKRDSEKESIRRISFFLTMALLFTCTYIIYRLTVYQEDQANNQPDEPQGAEEMSALESFIQDQYQSLTLTFAIMIISIIIQSCFTYLVTIESYNTQTLYNINLAQKLSLALFINGAVVTCFISVVYTENVWGKGGLIYTIFYYFTFDSITSFVSQFLDWDYLSIQIQKWWYVNRQGRRCLLTQKEANELLQLPDHEIEVCYAEIMNTMYITIFYAPAVPLGLFFALISIFLYFWVQKYTLFRRKSVEKQISVKLSIEMTEYLEYVISIYAVSNALFKWQTVGGFPTLQIVGAIIGLLYSVSPVQLFVEKVFDFESEEEDFDYKRAKPYFITTYGRTNPVTAFQKKQKSENRSKVNQLERL